MYATEVAEVASVAPAGSTSALYVQLCPALTDVYSPRFVFAVTAPSIKPSELAAIADTTTLVWPLNAMRVPPKPLNESAPLLAVETRVQVLPASVERKIPNPK